MHIRNLERLSTRTQRLGDEKRTSLGNQELTEFNDLWSREIAKYDNDLNRNLKKKVDFLKKKYRKEKNQVPDDIRGIVLKDQELNEEFSSTPRKYGGVALSREEEALLTLPPKFSIHRRVNEEECKAQIEKTMAKLRWEYSAKGDDEGSNEERIWRNHTTQELDFSQMKASDLPFNKRIKVPEPMVIEAEVNFQNLKNKLNKCTNEYLSKQNKNKAVKAHKMNRRDFAL